MSDTPKKVIFLDRDGTLNIDKHFVHRIEQVELVDGVSDALRIFEGAGYLLAIVTNQSGVARGRFTEADVQTVNNYVRTILAERGVHIRAMAYCPYHIEGTVPKYAMDHECRKPNSGMAKQIEAVLGPIDYAKSWSIGDKITDHEFGVKLGMRTVLLRSENWTNAPIDPVPTVVANTLVEAAQKIKTL
jgi:D-glycero-D-manno-heptose 1,7-bisphosphate phosphatase